MAEHVQQIEVVRLILEGFQPGVDLHFGALLPLGGALAERFAQPAVYPGQIEKLAQLVVAVRQREVQPGAGSLSPGARVSWPGAAARVSKASTTRSRLPS